MKAALFVKLLLVILLAHPVQFASKPKADDILGELAVGP